LRWEYSRGGRRHQVVSRSIAAGSTFRLLTPSFERIWETWYFVQQDPEAGGDFFVREASADEVEDFALAGGQGV